MNDTITIADLEVHAHVGVPDEERATAQRLLLNLEMELPFTKAAANDDIEATIDYHAVSVAVSKMSAASEWRLIEKLAEDLAAMVLEQFKPSCVRVEIKKFILPDARHVSVRIERR